MAIDKVNNNPLAAMSTDSIGNAFARHFYLVLIGSPELVHRYFKDSSTMSRPGPDGTLKTVTTKKGIDDLICSLNYNHDYEEAQIMSLDTQGCCTEGINVSVSGCLVGKKDNNVRRKFTESFFLAPQEFGFYLQNNVFKFVEEDNELPLPLDERVIVSPQKA